MRENLSGPQSSETGDEIQDREIEPICASMVAGILFQRLGHVHEHVIKFPEKTW